MVDTDDAAVVARCLAGEHNAYEAIVTRYQKGLFNVALRMLGNYEDARDATQTAFIKAYEHLDSFNPEQRFFSWLYRILKNECLNALRARRPAEPVSLGLPAGMGPTRWRSENAIRPCSRRCWRSRWNTGRSSCFGTSRTCRMTKSRRRWGFRQRR